MAGAGLTPLIHTLAVSLLRAKAEKVHFSVQKTASRAKTPSFRANNNAVTSYVLNIYVFCGILNWCDQLATDLWVSNPILTKEK